MLFSLRLATGLLALAALAPHRSFAQAPPAPPASDIVEVLPAWKAGQSWAVVYRKTQTRTRGADTLLARDVTTHFDVTVQDAGPDGALVRWMPVSQTSDPGDEALTDALAATQNEALARVGRDGYLLGFDTDGTYTGIDNVDDLARIMGLVLEHLDTSSARLDPPQQASMAALMARMQRPEVLEQMVGEPFQIFHQFYGYALTMGQREAFTDTVDVPLFGVRVPGDAVLETARLSDDAVDVRYKRVLRPERLRVLLDRIPATLRLDAEARRAFLSEIDRAAMARTDETRWRISAATGEVTSVTARSVVHGADEGEAAVNVTTHTLRRVR